MNTGKFSYDYQLSSEEIAKNILKSANAHWSIATNTISSKEYWEKYFKEHPEKKPKHIVFYKGSPTNAVHAFLRSNNIGQADVSRKE